MHRLRSILAASALFLFASSASAVTITLSEMSSDGTDPGVLDASLVFTDLGSNQLELKVTNTDISTNTWDINFVAFNLDGASVTSIVSVASPNSGWTLGSGSVAGFGSFEVHLTDGTGPGTTDISPGETKTFVLAYSGTLAAGILEANSPQGKMVAAKFVRGGDDPDCAGVDPNSPTQGCPQGFNTEDSAFGASGSASIVPEPFTSVLLLTGLAGLLVAGRRRV